VADGLPAEKSRKDRRLNLYMASAGTQAGVGHVPIDLCWRGPYGWPRVERADSFPRLDQSADGKRGGVYLEASEYDGGGYILLSAGITRRPFPKRFAEHRRKFLSGDYNILDVKCLRAGVRKSARTFQDIPDKGLHLEPRYASETPILARNHCDHFLHSLPGAFEL